MRKPLFIMATVFVIVLVIVLWRMPASWSLGILRGTFPELAWANVHGNTWHGTASGVRWADLHLGRVDWHFAGVVSRKVLRGRWHLRGEGPQYRLSAVLAPSLDGSVHISDLHGSIPAAWVDISAAAPFTYPSGRLRIHLERLRFSPEGLRFALGDIRWAQAALSGIVDVPLGAIQARLRPAQESEPGGVHVTLSSHGPGDVLVQGVGLILGPRFEFSLELDIATHRADLRERLSRFGQTAENGTISIQLQGY